MKHRFVRTTASLTLLAAIMAACSTGQAPADDETSDAASTESADTGDSDDTEGEGSGEALKIGSIVPQTGPLAFFGPPLTEATRMAIEDINAAGGVLGQDVPDVEFTDDANDAAIASQSADRLLRSGVDAIVGAAGSAMSLAVIDKITGAEVVQCSPSNTAPTFTDYDDGGYYIRTAPSDGLQGPVLANLMIESGAETAALVARADDYGQGLINTITPVLEDAGVEIVASTLYDPLTTNFDATVQQIVSGSPDAVAVISFEEGAQLMQGLIEAGVTPDSIYGSDGIRSEELASKVSPDDPSVLDGFRGTAGDPSASPDFIDRLMEFAPQLTDTVYAAHTYDCTIVIALAAEAAGSTDPREFASHLAEVTRDGETCTSFGDCAALIADGADIDYDGASGPIELTDVGDPVRAVYEIWEFDEEGVLNSVDTRESA